MTAAELIAEVQKLDPTTRVCHYDGDRMSIQSVRSVEFVPSRTACDQPDRECRYFEADEFPCALLEIW